MKTRAWFEQWLNAMNNHNLNGADLPNLGASGGDGSYSVDIDVFQLERAAETAGSEPATDKNVIRQYKLKYAFPTSVSQIDLAYDSNDQIEEFTVEFQYSYWTAPGGGRGASSNNPAIDSETTAASTT